MAANSNNLPSAAALRELADQTRVHRFIVFSLKRAEEAALKGEHSCPISFYDRNIAEIFGGLLHVEREGEHPGWFRTDTRPFVAKWDPPEAGVYFETTMTELGYTFEYGQGSDGYGTFPRVNLRWPSARL